MHTEAFSVFPEMLTHPGPDDWTVLPGHFDGGIIDPFHASRPPAQTHATMAWRAWVDDMSLHAITEVREACLQQALRETCADRLPHVDRAFPRWTCLELGEGFPSFDIRELCQAITARDLAAQGENARFATLRRAVLAAH